MVTDVVIVFSMGNTRPVDDANVAWLTVVGWQAWVAGQSILVRTRHYQMVLLEALGAGMLKLARRTATVTAATVKLAVYVVMLNVVWGWVASVSG